MDGSPAADRPVAPDPRAAICSTVEAGTNVAYDAIQSIFDKNCVTCHGGAGDLVLQDGVSWGDIVNRTAMETCGGTLVVPGNPGESYLYQKLTNASPCSGSQMPRGEFFVNPLPACVIDIIEAWISDGAPGPGPDGG